MPVGPVQPLAEQPFGFLGRMIEVGYEIWFEREFREVRPGLPPVEKTTVKVMYVAAPDERGFPTGIYILDIKFPRLGRSAHTRYGEQFLGFLSLRLGGSERSKV